MNGVGGKQRGVGIVILLIVVTFGIYWFYWMYKALGEIAANRGKSIGQSLMVPILLVLWIVEIALILQAIPEATADELFPAPDLADPFVLASAGAGILFFAIQGFYLFKATNVVREAAAAVASPKSPNAIIAVIFCALHAVGRVPVTALFVASIAGFVLSIIWLVKTQGALNFYWVRTAGWPAPAGMPGGPTPVGLPAHQAAPTYAAPNPGYAPQTQAFTPQPEPGGMVTREFSCPNCRSRMKATYVPGTPTSVVCPQCGTKGTVR